jgi:EAL domain-containing protein (putative c-di-GMP-specific phosphodiesterase class I)/PAS domain-containing protein
LGLSAFARMLDPGWGNYFQGTSMMLAGQNRLREERDRFVGFAFSHADLLVELDAQASVMWAGGALRSMLGIETEDLIGTPFLSVVDPTDSVLLKSAINRLLPGQRRRDMPVTLRNKQGAPVASLISINRSVLQDHNIFFLSVTIGPQEASQKTGVPARNRMTGLLEAAEFTQAATDAFHRARADGNSACLTLLEICESSELERLLGSTRAESLLAEIGAQLKLHAMDYDSAAHIGDGKFGLAHFAQDSSASIVAAIAEVGRSYNLDEEALHLSDRTISLQDSALADDDVEGILAYVVERFSRDGTAGLTTGTSAVDYLRKMTAETLSRVVAMRDLIHEHRITLHYQPIVHLATRIPHHHEVLLRFADGRSPFEDVKFAEEINIIHELDLAVTQGAIRQITKDKSNAKPVHLAVNMSARSLLNDTFLDMFEQLAQRMGQRRGQLIVEITESAKLDDLNKAARAVDRLRSGGHSVCLDDFGAGASSLPYLQQLLVDYVKIDGVYIRSITESLRERAIVQGVLTTCRCLGIKTVAEMVEKEDQHKCLADLGVDLGQGWLYGRPASDIESVPKIALTRRSRRTGAKDVWS